MLVTNYLIVNANPPPGMVWSPSLAHATPFQSQSDAEQYRRKAVDASGVKEIEGKWYIVKEPSSV